MDGRYLFDTNVLIYYFNGFFSEDDREIDTILAESFNISIITRIEFLGWAGFSTDSMLYENANEFIGNATIFDLDDAIAEETIKIRLHSRIKIPDAIIAATSKVHGLRLLTNDADGYKKLGINVSNPLS